MNFIFRSDQNFCEINLSGLFTFADHLTFRAALDKFGTSSVKKLILDFSNVEFIDSGGLGMLLLAREEARQKNASITLRHPQGQVKRMFDLSEFNTLFIIE